MRSFWVLLAALACLAPAGTARGEREPRGYERLVLDRVDLEPSPLPGLARLRVLVSAIALQSGGAVIKIGGDRAWQLRVGSSRSKAPYAAGAYGDADAVTAIVLVVSTSAELGEALPAAKAALVAGLLEKFPTATAPMVGVLGYGDGTSDTGKLDTAAKAVGRLQDLPVETSAEAPDLVDALETAMRILRRVKTRPEGRPVRKMIVLVSDGRNRDPDRDTITDLGARAGRAGIRIHSLAYVPSTGSKGSLLNLGELSRKSLGTFRWVRLATETSWAQQVDRLLAEIQQQYVLTFFVPAEEVAGRQLSIATKINELELVSNRLRAPPLRCGRLECPVDGYCVAGRCVVRSAEEGLGILGWLLALGGGLAGLGAAAVAVRTFRRRRGSAAVAGAAPHGAPQPGPAPGVRPSVSAALPAASGAGTIQPIGAPVGAGHPAPAHHPGQAAQPAPPAAVAQPVLYVMNGPRTGHRIPLHNGFLIGKAPGSHLHLDQDGFASSVHATITVDARGTCTLVDRGSTNGTYVNGIRVHAPVVLTHGMTVRVGATELRFLTQ